MRYSDRPHHFTQNNLSESEISLQLITDVKYKPRAHAGRDIADSRLSPRIRCFNPRAHAGRDCLSAKSGIPWFLMQHFANHFVFQITFHANLTVQSLTTIINDPYIVREPPCIIDTASCSRIIKLTDLQGLWALLLLRVQLDSASLNRGNKT